MPPTADRILHWAPGLLPKDEQILAQFRAGLRESEAGLGRGAGSVLRRGDSARLSSFVCRPSWAVVQGCRVLRRVTRCLCWPEPFPPSFCGLGHALGTRRRHGSVVLPETSESGGRPMQAVGLAVIPVRVGEPGLHWGPWQGHGPGHAALGSTRLGRPCDLLRPFQRSGQCLG